MSSLNRASLIGNVGQRPEIRATQAGARIATFSLATGESWKDKATGEKRERTEWHRIVVFNDGLVGIVERFVDKGKKLFVEGQLRTRKWTDNAGTERYSTEIVLAQFGGQIMLLDGAGGSNGGGRGRRRPPADYGYGAGSPAAAAPRTARDELDDEIPF